MKYMGSKNRIAKFIVPILEKNREEGQWYIEPFVGGANMIDKMSGNRAGFDNNEYLIKALELIRDNPEAIPEIITEEYYQELKSKKEVNGITGFCAFAMSFGGKFFGGYRRDKAGSKGCFENMKTQTRRSKQNALKQSINIKEVYFNTLNFLDLKLKEKCLIYCDPPYEKTTQYKGGGFPHDAFWNWCRLKSKEGHKVFVSEYKAPIDFIEIWSKSLSNNISSKNLPVKKPIERLFIHESQKDLIVY